MKMHALIQGSPEWDALRAAHDTASEASAMMGASPKVKRSELLRMKATGSEKQFSDWVRENLLEKGHEAEAMARPIAERIIGAELFPVTVTEGFTDGGMALSLLASLDGITEDGDIAWECKLWNAAKAASVRDGEVPDEDKWQVVQQLAVSGADRCLYMVSDGTEERTVYCWVALQDGQLQDLLAGWRHFNMDRATYQPVEETPPVIAEAVEALPTVFVQVSGSVAVQNNLSTFDKALRFFLSETLITSPVTDQDFADLDLQIKAMKKAEEALEAAEAQALAQVREVDDFKRTKDMLYELVRKNRLASEKLYKAEQERRKLEIRKNGESRLAEHIRALNDSLGGGVFLPNVPADFAGAMKNKRTIASLEDAVATELARAKIAADRLAAGIAENLDVLREVATGYEFLFRDRQELVQKDKEAVDLIARQRVEEHKKAEEARLVAERERIRKEEAERLVAEQKAATSALQQQAVGLAGDLVEVARDLDARQVADEAEAKQTATNDCAVKSLPVTGDGAPADHDRQGSLAIAHGAALARQLAVDPASGPDKTAAAVFENGKVRSFATVANKLELLKAVLAGEVPDDVLAVDLEALALLCDSLGRSVPGVIWSKA